MTLTLVLLLVPATMGFETAGATPPGSGFTSTPQAGSPGTFRVEPLQLGPTAAPFRLTLPEVNDTAEVAPAEAVTGAGRETQLRNRSTGVTCTARIVTVGGFDPRMVADPAGLPHPDRIVGRGISPCVE